MKCFYYLLLLLLLISCDSGQGATSQEVDLTSYHIQPNMQLEVLVAEPSIESPINISFDDHGNMWALEMPGYMPNIEGLYEDAPVGRIQVFLDTDNDGTLETKKIVKDSMSLARAFAHVYGGLLYAEPPYLYFAEISNNFTLIKPIIVDSTYAVGGNAEHQANGLVMNIDNWIYNAKSSKRYRRIKGQWQIERTGFRGQWGISHDRYGRLLYNDNSNPLRGDIGIPGMLSINPQYKASKSFNHTILNDRKVYPIQATAVNRGYIEGTLDEDNKLIHFTSACSPLFFEGRLLDKQYWRDVFICAPEVNLIKRVKVNERDLYNTGTQAYENEEFLISSDESFRPVNIQNGPDGAMYIVDMHKGILQHKTYLTSYLSDQYIKKGLDKVKGMGRILRLSSKNKEGFRTVDLTKIVTTDLIDSLGSRNIWIRDKAQQIIIQRNDKSVYGKLVSFLKSVTKEPNRIQILYIMDALGILQDFHLKIVPADNHHMYLGHIIKLSKEYDVRIKDGILKKLIERKNDWIDYHLIYYLANKRGKNESGYLRNLMINHKDKSYFQEPLFAGMQGNETYLKKYLFDQNDLISEISKIEKQEPYPINIEIEKDGLTKGWSLYYTHCSSCHNPEGKGINGLGPPLLHSEYISKSNDHLISIICYGLQGPVTVNGITYNDGVAMPGIGGNKSISDEDIKDIANFVLNAFTSSNQSIQLEQVEKVRNMDRSKDKMFTTNELNEIFPIN